MSHEDHTASNSESRKRQAEQEASHGISAEEREQWRRCAESDRYYPGHRVAAGRILALLDALDAAERERDELRMVDDTWEERCVRARVENRELRAKIARVEALADIWAGTEGAYAHHGSNLSAAWRAAVTELRDALRSGVAAALRGDA